MSDRRGLRTLVDVVETVLKIVAPGWVGRSGRGSGGSGGQGAGSHTAERSAERGAGSGGIGSRGAGGARDGAAADRAPRPGPPPGGGARSTSSRDRARELVYAPDLDGSADPGEIVWAWVPYEENDGRGKDRPLLVVGRDGDGLLGLMLSSQSERADDRDWLGIGSGPWDREGRPSYVRLDRVLDVGEHDIRREGAVLPRDRFDQIAARLRAEHGWR